MKQTISVLIICLTSVIGTSAQDIAQQFPSVKEVKLDLKKCSVTILKRTDNANTIDFKFVNAKNQKAPIIELGNGRLRIDQSYEPGFFTMLDTDAELQLTVPDGIDFNIQMEDGDLSLVNVTGSFNSFLHKGDINGTVSTTGASHFESESGDVNIKLMKGLDFNISVASGSSTATLDFAGQAINGKVKMEAFYGSGTINSPLAFSSQNIIQSDGPNYITKSVAIGEKDINITLSTGPGTISLVL
ncbi:MAG: DUF4097 family beta strand repeat-containing protein [Cyclobacteriaceae bacterium]|nr:DUF4097 family beta strand repeat protein [Cyclobacteriaceae bacterium]